MSADICKWTLLTLMSACVMMVGCGALAQDSGPGSNDGVVLSLLTSAQEAIADGSHDDARQAIDAAMSLPAISPRERGMALYLRGQASYALGDVREAMADWWRALDEGELAAPQADAVRQALARLEEYLEDDAFGGDAGVAVNLFRRAHEAMEKEDFATAEELASRAVFWAGGTTDVALELDALNLLGMAQWRAGRLDAALTTYRRHADTAAAANRDRAMLTSFANMAVIAVEAERAGEAANALGRTLELAERFGGELTGDERSRMGIVSFYLGNLALFMNRYADAERYFVHAIEFSDDNGVAPIILQSRAMAMANVALAAHMLGNDEEADRRLRQLRDEALQRSRVAEAADIVESASAFASAVGGGLEAVCLFNGMAHELRILAGQTDDAYELGSVLEGIGCPGFEDAFELD